MPEVPVVDERLVREISGEVHQVSGLEVVQTKNQSALILSVAYRGWKRNGDGHDEEIRLALSPPAAAQLSRFLAEAVEGYLYGRPQDDQTQGDQG